MTTIGSLFSGYSGLDQAVESITGGRTVWRSDIDPGACKILAHHWPDIPNLGDITTVDWDSVEPVDIITGGFPCQDVSMAGRRAGLRDGTRSGLWAEMANAISILRPSLVVAENVRGVLSAAADSDMEPCPWCMGDADGEPPLRALGAVLGDLANIGYDAAWHGLTAASVGAPHGRFRVFLIAWPQPGDTDSSDRNRGSAAGFPGKTGPQAGLAQDTYGATRGERWVAAPGQAQGGWARPDAGGSGGACPADTDRAGLAQRASITGDDEPEQSPAQRSDRIGAAAPDANGGGCEVSAELNSEPPQAPTDRHSSREHVNGHLCSGSSIAWGQFEPAIRQWERLTRPTPAPTETSSRGGQRLSPMFVEWMMGLPEGHVTAVPGLTRNEQLKALGNGVVPQQAEAALRVLLNAMAVAA